MDMQKYLKQDLPIKLSYVARLMWPESASPEIKLSRKLNNVRPWTDQDNEKAVAAVKQLYDGSPFTSS